MGARDELQRPSTIAPRERDRSGSPRVPAPPLAEASSIHLRYVTVETLCGPVEAIYPSIRQFIQPTVVTYCGLTCYVPDLTCYLPV
jgi:hypothetical protein